MASGRKSTFTVIGSSARPGWPQEAQRCGAAPISAAKSLRY